MNPFFSFKRLKFLEFNFFFLPVISKKKQQFLKQIKIIYGSGFSDEERRQFRLVIISNIINSIRILILAMKIFQIPYENQENEVYLKLFLKLILFFTN